MCGPFVPTPRGRNFWDYKKACHGIDTAPIAVTRQFSITYMFQRLNDVTMPFKPPEAAAHKRDPSLYALELPRRAR